MGVSTSAYLVYGVDLGDDTPWLDEDNHFDWDDDDDSKTIDILVANSRCDITTHCSCDYVMRIVSIDEPGFSARRGYPETIDPQELTINPEWNERLKRACADIGVEYSEPHWILCSWWG